MRKVPRYVAKVLALAATLPSEPAVHHMTVLHDDWCDLLNGRGACNCEPELGPVSTEPPKVKP